MNSTLSHSSLDYHAPCQTSSDRIGSKYLNYSSWTPVFWLKKKKRTGEPRAAFGVRAPKMFQSGCIKCLHDDVIPLLSGCQVHRAPYRARSPGSWRKMRTSSFACQARNTKCRRERAWKDRIKRLLSIYVFFFLCCVRLHCLALTTLGVVEAQNCRQLEKAVSPPPSLSQPWQSLCAQHDPFHSFPLIPFLFLLLHATLLRMPKPTSQGKN